VNNRNQNPQWQYDAAGHLSQQALAQGTRQYSYDVVGRQVTMTEPGRRPNESGLTMTQGYDGDGRRGKLTETTAISNVVKYEVRSTVLGGRVITELNQSGQKVTTNVYANGTLLAKQTSSDYVTWVHNSPDGSGEWQTFDGSIIGSARATELDPLGDDVGIENPYLMGGGDGVGSYPNYGDPTDMTAGCVVDGFGVPCRYAYKVVGWRGVGSVRVSFYSPPGVAGGPVFIPTRDGVNSRVGEYDGNDDTPTNDPSIVFGDWSKEVFTKSGYFVFPQNPQQTTQPISAGWDKSLHKSYDDLIFRLNWGEISDDCRKNVLDKLKGIGFDLGDFLSYLSSGYDFNDGTKSKEPLVNVANQNQVNVPGVSTVGDLFNKLSGLTALTSGVLSPTRFTVFFSTGNSATNLSNASNSYRMALLFHEAIHGYGSSLTGGNVVNGSVFGSFGDKGLMTLFGLTGSSSQITQYIQDHCF
jgi:YD repeat-containing protein